MYTKRIAIIIKNNNNKNIKKTHLIQNEPKLNQNGMQPCGTYKVWKTL